MPFDQIDFVVPATTAPDPVLDTLVKAHELIKDEKNWCGDGPGDGENSFCLLIALAAASARVAPGMARDAINIMYDAPGVAPPNYIGIPTYNDTHTHADVLAWLQRAISARRGA